MVCARFLQNAFQKQKEQEVLDKFQFANDKNKQTLRTVTNDHSSLHCSSLLNFSFANHSLVLQEWDHYSSCFWHLFVSVYEKVKDLSFKQKSLSGSGLVFVSYRTKRKKDQRAAFGNFVVAVAFRQSTFLRRDFAILRIIFVDQQQSENRAFFVSSFASSCVFPFPNIQQTHLFQRNTRNPWKQVQTHTIPNLWSRGHFLCASCV